MDAHEFADALNIGCACRSLDPSRLRRQLEAEPALLGRAAALRQCFSPATANPFPGWYDPALTCPAPAARGWRTLAPGRLNCPEAAPLQTDSTPLMTTLPPCPKCASPYTYEDGTLLVCPECAHEWGAGAEASTETARVWKDANGNLLQDGDSVTVIKDLKVKGSSAVVKVGTKVKNIRLIDGDHDIDCKIDGFGPMQLKSEFVKKA
jgi:protein PhnA